MKRTSVKLKLKQRLQLVRTTVRELSAVQLEAVQGGASAGIQCQTLCCDGYSGNSGLV